MNNLYRANSYNEENRGANAPHKSKINFKKYKDNTIHSLNEVGYFFYNFNHFLKYIKLYKLFK